LGHAASPAPSRIEVLAHQAARGDVAAFDELVALHESRVVNLAYRLVNDSTDAEDVAQEAFVKAFRSLPRLRDKGQFSGWVLRITVNAARDHLRRRKSRDEVGLEAADNLPGAASTADVVEHQVAQERIRHLLATMAQKHREVLVLRDIEGMSYEEIAEVLHCTVSGVKNRLHRARAAFRQRAAPYVDEVLGR
jgi:RNA polymerase sigma-70 factor (ECF subfamily)